MGAEADQDTSERKIAFDMIKSNFFRVIQVEGAFGGISPHALLRIALFNERFAIPKHMEHVLAPDGTVGRELRSARDGRDAVVREVECELVMTLESARTLHRWLGDKIKDLEQLRGTIAAATADDTALVTSASDAGAEKEA